MATSKEFINFMEEKLGSMPGFHTKAMFGEYAYYFNNVVVGLICDETIYLKITPQTTTQLGEDTEKGPPYPGAKDQYILNERLLDDKNFMLTLLKACSEDVIAAKAPKSKKKKS